MITAIELHNWKSFEQSTLLIDQITFLIGTNASGKSNLVDALKFLSGIRSGRKLTDVCNEIRGGVSNLIRRHCNESSIAVTIKSNGITYSYTLRFTVEDSEAFVTHESLYAGKSNNTRCLYQSSDLHPASPDHVKESLDNPISVAVPKDRSGFRLLQLRRDEPILTQVGGLNVIKEVKEAAQVVLNSFESIYILDPNPAQMRHTVSPSDQLNPDGSNVAGVIAKLPAKSAKSFEDELTKYVSKLPEKDLRRIWVEKFGPSQDLAMLYCEERWDEEDEGTIVDARSMSDGTLRFIAIVVALLTRHSDSLLVIEEIDNGLHASRVGELIAALIELASAGDFDVLCTTHNPVLIDTLPSELLESVSCVTREGAHGTTSIYRLTERPNFLKDLAWYSPGKMMIKNILSGENPSSHSTVAEPPVTYKKN